MALGKGFFGWFLFIALAVMLIMLLNKNSSNYATIPLSEFVDRLENGKVQQVVIDSDEVIGQFTSPQTIGQDRIAKFRVPLVTGTTSNWTFQQWVVEHRQGAQVDVENTPNWVTQILVPLAPWLLIFAFIWFFVFRQLRKVNELQQTRAKEPTRVFVVNLPGEPPLASEATTPPPR